MKRFTTILSVPLLLILLLTSCVEDYLNKAPESGLTEADVFSKYENFKKFFDAIYEGNKNDNGTMRAYNIKNAYSLYFDFWDQKYTMEALTDMSDMGRVMDAQVVKSGQS
jgi:starch-binding outer membrane protein, SusD/RagB family